MSASAAPSELPVVPLSIGNEPVVTGEWLDVMDPAAPRQVVGRVALASEALSRRAVDVAHAAAERWGALEPERRAEQLLAAVKEVEASQSQNAELLVRENGKVRFEAEADVAVFTGRCRLAAGLAPELLPQRLPRAGATPAG